ncbi:MAG TPA: hypothetical protein PL009_14550 [Flavipsychrobacter sp.]|nr:hypothetical protein [Flavipsychrobacter sp.]
MKNQTKVLVHKKECLHLSGKQAWEQVRKATEEIVASFNSLGLPPLTPSEFPRLFTDVDALCFDKITGGSLEIGGVSIARETAVGMVQKPEGYDAFKSRLNEFLQNLESGYFSHQNYMVQISGSQMNELFELLKDMKVCLTKEHCERVANEGLFYADTEGQERLNEFIKRTVDNYFSLGLHKDFGKEGIAGAAIIKDRCLRPLRSINEDGTFVIDPNELITASPL